MHKPLALVALAVTVAALPLACSKKQNPPPVTPTVTADAGADADGGDEGGLALAGEGGAPEAGLPVATGDAGPLGLPSVAAEAMDGAIDLAIKAAAASAAPKMSPEGAAGRATLAEGGHFSMMVTMAPNRCYTVVGFSPLGQIQTLDIKLMAPPLFNVVAGTSGAKDKNTPVLGRGKQALCPIVPIPVPYKLDVEAKKGAGRMAVQVFARNK
jgi:hypothetical protein